MQIVQPRIGIVVVSPVPEGVQRADNLLLRRGGPGGIRIGEVASGIIGVGADFCPVLGVDGDDVPLQVLLEVVGVKRPCRITGPVVLQTHGQAVLIVQVDQQVVEGLRPAAVPGVLDLTDDLRAVQRVVVDRTAICLDGSDAIGVIREGIQELSPVHGHLHKLAAAPGQGVAVVCSRITNAIV